VCVITTVQANITLLKNLILSKRIAHAQYILREILKFQYILLF